MEIINYIISPYYKHPDNFNIKKDLRYTFKAYGLALASIFLAGMIVMFLNPFLSKLLNKPSILAEFRGGEKKMISKYGNFTYLLVCLFVPIIEEVIFRLPLLLKRSGFSLCAAILFYRFSGEGVFKISFANYTGFLRIAETIAIGIFVYFLLKNNWLTFIRDKYFKYFFWLSATIFGLVHIFNNPNVTFLFFPLYVIYVLPQIIMGFFLGTVRMNKGFWASVLLHSMFNSLSIIF